MYNKKEDQPAVYYQSVINENIITIATLKKQIHLMGTIRLFLLIGWIAHLLLTSHLSWLSLTGITLLYFIPFTGLMVFHNKLAIKRQYAETLRTLCENELKVLQYDYSAFEDGATSKDVHHPFSLDLDLFGEQSVFQSINRTVTPCGYDKLTGWLLNPLTRKPDILARQEAVEELSGKPELRQHFYVTGYATQRDKNDADLLEKLTEHSAGIRYQKIWSILTVLIPALWLVILPTTSLGLVDSAIIVLFFIVSGAIANSKFKQVTEVHRTLDKIQKIMSAYASLIVIIEKGEFQSRSLTDLQQRLLTNSLTASKAINQLTPILKVLDQRASLPGVLFNVFTLREIRAIIRLDRWKQMHHEHIAQWFESLADFDALCSLAGFAFNNSDYIYPKITEEYFTLSGKAVGHPLIPREKCVKNDIQMEKHPYFMIITGANMAGKSTYLRTIGINYLLACIGAPVCATELMVFPAAMVTSLRTSDSLKDNESYFFTELKRLKMIIDRLQNGEKLFIILDEILKGTNSEDKQKGSLALIRQFMTYQTCGLIATHDLILGNLRNEHPDNIENFRFEADIEEDKLSFSYRMKEGVAQNMNACFLMKKMGITV